jgi:hypothetical protein
MYKMGKKFNKPRIIVKAVLQVESLAGRGSTFRIWLPG